MLVVEKGLRRNDNLLLLTASDLTVILTRFYATTLSFGEEGNKKIKKPKRGRVKGEMKIKASAKNKKKEKPVFSQTGLLALDG